MIGPRLAAALAHPIRVHIISVLTTRSASVSALAGELDMPTKNVSYHIKVLEKLGCIELVQAKPALGGRVVEHIYRATSLQYFDEEAWDQLDMKGKWGVVIPIMRRSSQDINESLVAGVFLDPDDNHLSRTPLVVDGQGWEEVKDALGDTLNRIFEIREKVAARREEDETIETMAIKVQMFQFRSPDSDKDA
jgi:DNA-binding transcriptional ArsR family regulator